MAGASKEYTASNSYKLKALPSSESSVRSYTNASGPDEYSLLCVSRGSVQLILGSVWFSLVLSSDHCGTTGLFFLLLSADDEDNNEEDDAGGAFASSSICFPGDETETPDSGGGFEC